MADEPGMTDIAVPASDLAVLLEEVERAARPTPAAVAAASRLRSAVTPSLFDPPPPEAAALPDPGGRVAAAHRGGDTDMAAAYAVEPRAGTQRLRVLEALRAAGTQGHTDEELEERLGLRRPSPGNRRGELVAGGWVHDSGRRRPTRSGNPAVVWTITLAGWARLESEKR